MRSEHVVRVHPQAVNVLRLRVLLPVRALHNRALDEVDLRDVLELALRKPKAKQ